MAHFIKFQLFIWLTILGTSCSLIGINFTYKTPKKPGKYPTFKEEDYLLGSNSELRKSFDVTYYDINLDLDVKHKKINGYVDIHFLMKDRETPLQNTALVDTLQLDLHQNLQIDAIVFQNDTLKYVRKYNTLFVLFEKQIPKNQVYQMRIYYNGSPMKAKRPPWEGGFVWKKDDNNNPWVSVACQDQGAHIWFPLKDHLSDEPDSVRFSMTVPKGLFCVSNGKLVEQTKMEEKEKFVWRTSYPINTYNISFYVGDYVRFTLPYNNKGVKRELEFYVLSYDLDIARSQFKQAVEVVEFYENTLAPFPWWNDGYKMVESPFMGMEHQTAIAYGNKFQNTYGPIDYIILHETGHEWWGNSVSAGDNAEMFLHEGFTTFMDAFFMEQKMGYDFYLRMMRFQYGIVVQNKRPLVGPRDVNYSNYKDSDPYMKGALMLHTLRNILNDDQLFINILKTYYNRHQYSIVTTTDFIKVVNELTGKDYQWFFDQYVYSRVCPQLEWNLTYDTSKQEYVLKYRWKNVGNQFILPIVVETNYGNITINPTADVQQKAIKEFGNLRINPNFSFISMKQNKKL
ncbi:MAG: aminopeptidase [Bacteroidetes bacterium]|nr:aminopeptidase [Bacteroidota bacterium]